MNRGNQTNAQNVYKSQDKFLKYWSLELQLLEEPPVLSALVTVLELGPHHIPCLFLLHGVLQQFLVEVGLVETDVHGVASRHHVVVVDDLQERLNLGPLLDLLFGHLLGDLAGILVNPGHQSVAERFVASSLVGRFHDDCLPSGIPAGQQQDDLPALHYLAHDGLSCRSESSNKSLVVLESLV